MQASSAWNQDQLFSSKSVEWSTPQDLFDHLHREFRFGLDVCANSRNAKCPAFIDKDADTLATPWADRIDPGTAAWMNPPWGRGIGSFLQRAFEESNRSHCVCVCLVPAATDTQWWRTWVWMASEVRLIVGRLHFVRDDGHTGPAPKGAALVIFTPWSFGPPRVFLADKIGRTVA